MYSSIAATIPAPISTNPTTKFSIVSAPLTPIKLKTIPMPFVPSVKSPRIPRAIYPVPDPLRVIAILSGATKAKNIKSSAVKRCRRSCPLSV